MSAARALALVALLGLGAGGAQASFYGDELGISPFEDWRTLKAGNFDVHHPVELAATATAAAEALQEAHVILKDILLWEPRHRVQVMLLNSTDAANGSAGPALRFGITLNATPPESWFSIGQADDWIRLLAVHEYAHYLNMDALDGGMWAFWVVFGDAVRPNGLWAPWMLEGLSVVMETRHTRAGRGRSAEYDMVIRAAVRDGLLGDADFMTLGRMGGRNPWFPDGETPYMFGFHLMNEVVRGMEGKARTHDGRETLSSGEQALGRLSVRSSGRVPFFVNGNLRAVTGRRWHDVWKDWAKGATARAKDQLKRLAAAPLTPIERLTPAAQEVLGPRPSPDGKFLAYTAATDDRGRNGLYLLDLFSGETRRLGSKRMGATQAFTPDGRWILTSSLHPVGQYNLYSDLLAVNSHNGREIWLTTGLRAKDPAISADGRNLVFTRSRGATVGVAAGLIEVDEDGEPTLSQVRDLYVPQPHERASQPTLSPDGRWVVFGLQRMGEPSEDLLRVPLEGGRPETLVQTGARNRFPAYSAQGELHYISDITGVENLFRHRPGSTPLMVTHVDSGIRFPVFSAKDELFVSHFSSEGWAPARVGTIGAKESWKELSLERPSFPESELMGSSGVRERIPSGKPVESAYSPWGTFFVPRQWAPYIQGSGSGFYLSGQLLGFDALDFHEYVLSGAFDSYVGLAEGALQYAYRGMGPTLSLGLSHETTFVFPGGASGPEEFDRR
ncbi:MAG: PD40 domain-containing protein, partial [Bdellovibrionales bacterium]|nr:PD40 domain-containing protein [Bdellovibrionales bacterium]